jgi:hypothetical protein
MSKDTTTATTSLLVAEGLPWKIGLMSAAP